MGAVVAVGRRLAKYGAAVIFIHHPTQGARAILAELTGTRRDGVPISEWQEACVEGRKVSGADNVESRKKAMSCIVKSLAQKGLIEIRNDRVFVPGEARDWGAEFDHEDEAEESLI